MSGRSKASLVLSVALLFGTEPSAFAQAKPTSPQDFAMAAAQSDAYEISAARVAEVEGVSPAVRNFATELLHDHTASTLAIKAAAAKAGLPPPPETPNPDQARMLSALQSLRGAEFDREYITQQVVAHHGALTVEEQYAGAGTEPNLKQAAIAALPMIRQHLATAEQLHSSMP